MKQTIQIVSIFTVIVLVLTSAHMGYRLYKIHSILDEPACVERMELMPRSIEFCAEKTEELTEINIGYGAFKTDLEFQFSSKGNKHAVIWGEADDIRLYIMPPHKARYVASAIASEVNNLAKLPPDHPWREIIGKDTDTFIDLLIRSEHAEIRSFAEVVLMSNSEFSAYLYQLLMKGTLSTLASEMFEYSTTRSRGFIHVAKYKTDKIFAACAIEDIEKNITVGFNFILSNSRTNNVLKIIEPILATLAFDDQIDCDELIISAKILDAGIQPYKKDSQPVN